MLTFWLYGLPERKSHLSHRCLEQIMKARFQRLLEPDRRFYFFFRCFGLGKCLPSFCCGPSNRSQKRFCNFSHLSQSKHQELFLLSVCGCCLCNWPPCLELAGCVFISLNLCIFLKELFYTIYAFVSPSNIGEALSLGFVVCSILWWTKWNGTWNGWKEWNGKEWKPESKGVIRFSSFINAPNP